MHDEIIKAIKQRKRLRIFYEPGERIIEPHAFGQGSEQQFLLRAYQTEGASESGKHEYWKLLRVDRMDIIEILNETFDGPRPQYNPKDSAMKGGIICCLEVEGV